MSSLRLRTKRQSTFDIRFCCPNPGSRSSFFRRHFQQRNSVEWKSRKSGDGADGTAPALTSYFCLELRFQFGTKTPLPTTALRHVTRTLPAKMPSPWVRPPRERQVLGQILSVDVPAPLSEYRAMLGETQKPIRPHPRSAEYLRERKKQILSATKQTR